MPREAREKKMFSYYHIQQHCDKAIKIFKTKKDKLLFLETLQKVKEKYNFKLYGVAINKTGFELLLYDNGSDISKIMKSLNISFAMKFKCNHEDCKVVFKERYRSEILDGESVELTLKKLPACMYVDEDMLDQIGETDHVENICIECYEKATEKLNKLLIASGVSFDEMLKNKSLRNELIKDFRKQTTLNLSQLGDLFGGLSESGVSKILSR
jgi:hypothetical protein